MAPSTGPNGALSSESTVSGVAPRAHEPSFGHRVLDLVGDLGGEGAPKLPPQAREHAAVLVDAGLEQALSAARRMATGDASELRTLQRWLMALVLVLAFAFIGVLFWSVYARLEAVESAEAATQAQVTEAAEYRSEAAEHREKLDANVKTLAGHAVALTETVNESALATYDLLASIAAKVEAPIPGSAQRPEKIEAPVVLRYIAGER